MRVVRVAGVTVAVGTLALLVSPFRLFAALGQAQAFTVLVGAVAALVLTPALMAVLGHRLFRLRGKVPVTRSAGAITVLTPAALSLLGRWAGWPGGRAALTERGRLVAAP